MIIEIYEGREIEFFNMPSSKIKDDLKKNKKLDFIYSMKLTK